MSQMTTGAAAITVNGQLQPYQSQTIRELLLARGFDPEKPGIAVAINASIVHRADWNSRQLQPNDRVEIVRATVGG